MPSPSSFDMLHLISGFHVARAIYVAAKLGLADQLSAGSQTCAELAATTGADPTALRRLLRVLASAGVFGLEGDRASQTPLSATLQSGSTGSLRGWAIDQLGGEHYQAWGELLHSVRTGGVAFERVFGKNAWEHRAENPQSAQEFDDGMASFIDAHNQAVLDAYPFERLKSLYDIAGGDGQFMSAALACCPNLHGLVLEQSQVAARARQRLAQAGLAARCEVVAGDIFKAIPRGSEAYLMSRVIHDWNDAEALQILTLCRRAMGQDSVLLLVERVLPEQCDTSPVHRALAVSDLNMLVMTGGCERTVSQYRALLQAAGLELHTVTGTSTAMSVIEALPFAKRA